MGKYTYRNRICRNKIRYETEDPAKKVTIRSNFILSKNLSGEGLTIQFRDINNNLVQYNHDRVLEQLDARATNLPCWDRYGYYTNSKKTTKICRKFRNG